MELGYVYVARLIDYSGNFLGNFHKIGKSIQYKVRETQLNSTHLPVDILFVRVFETENMSGLESILQTCFEDYRVEKKYNDRRNITTEWFDVEDTDVLNYRIDKVIKYIPNTTEVNVISKIVSDNSTSLEEKEEFVSALKKGKTKLTLKFEGNDISQTLAADTFTLGLGKIAEVIGWEKLDFDEDLVTTSTQELVERYGLTRTNHPAIREFGGYKVWTGISNQMKAKILSKHILRNNISELEVNYETIS